MRIRAEERPLPLLATCSLSITTIRPARRFAKWKAIDVPITPAPMTMKSAELPFAFDMIAF
jgi:hypothetical protein